MRIAYLSPSGQVGGAEASLLDVLSSIRTAEPDWPLHLITSAEGPLVRRAEALGVTVNVLPFPKALARLGDHSAGLRQSGGLLPRLMSVVPGVAVYVQQLRRLLRDISPDLVHSNGLKMHILGVWAKPAGVPVIWHLREYVSSRPAMSRLLRWHASRCAAAVAISSTVASDLQKVCRGRVKTHLVYNAVDTDAFSPDGPVADLDSLAGLPPSAPGTIRVGLAATLATWKGHGVFLRAISMLPSSFRIRGYIIGGEVYEPAGSQASLRDLQFQAEELGIGSRIGFTGFVQQPAAALRALDVVVHASTHPEPFGRVIVEAMACGRAVIASQAGGAAEIIQPGKDALAHAPGDAAALAERISQLVTDSCLRSRLAEAGRASALRRFDRARLATELLPIYREVALQP